MVVTQLLDETEIVKPTYAELAAENIRLKKLLDKDKFQKWINEQLFLHLPICIFWQDKHNVVLGVNDYQLKMLGIEDKSKIIGKHLYEISELGSRDVVDKIINNNQSVFNAGSIGKVFLFQEKAMDDKVWLSAKFLLRQPSDGELILFGMLVDVTMFVNEINFSNTSRDKVKVFLDNILEVLPGNAFWVDHQGVILGMNKYHAHGLGFDKIEDVLNKTIFEIQDVLGGAEAANNIMINNKKVIDDGGLQIFEECGVLNGKTCVFLSHKKPLVDRQGNVLGIIGLSLDMTHLKQQVEADLLKAKRTAEQASKIKTEVLSNMRHDFRTPLGSLVGLAQLLKEIPDETEKAIYIDDIIQISKTCLSLFDSVIEYTDFQTGLWPLKIERFSLVELFSALDVQIEAMLQNKPQLDYKTSYSKSLPDWVLGDRSRLYRVLFNLINNAFKYTVDGGIEFKVDLVNKNTQGDLLLSFEVIDTGVGIPKDMQEDVFKRFSRVVSSYQCHEPGLGLGLCIVKEFVEDMQAKIYLDSEVGQGSRFCVEVLFQLPS